ncbi:MAG: hypothetical protein KAI66_25930 [Lentisphaeria bacterium]|nr:hypothetical protein [Lentisphaeria bacterium]
MMTIHEKHAIHELGILRHVEQDCRLSNRLAARKLGVSIKLAHQILTGMVRRGLLHVRKIHSRRWDYFLTPGGITAKTRLTLEFLDFSMRFYREARRRSSQLCRRLSESGADSVVFIGSGDLAEIAYLGVQEWGLQLAAVYDEPAGTTFMGIRVEPLSRLSDSSTLPLVVCLYDTSLPMGGGYLPDGVKRSANMHWMFDEAICVS